jgi:2-iminobutanoate/2-iminopropanoate deaminase
MSKKEIIGGEMIVNGRQLPLSRAVRAGGFIFVSGQLPLENGRLAGDEIKTQARRTLDNVKTILAEAGTSLGDVVKCTIWLTDAADFAAFNEVYAEYFPTLPPARSCVVSTLVVPGAKVEIEAIALAP